MPAIRDDGGGRRQCDAPERLFRRYDVVLLRLDAFEVPEGDLSRMAQRARPEDQRNYENKGIEVVPEQPDDSQPPHGRHAQHGEGDDRQHHRSELEVREEEDDPEGSEEEHEHFLLVLIDPSHQGRVPGNVDGGILVGNGLRDPVQFVEDMGVVQLLLVETRAYQGSLVVERYDRAVHVLELMNRFFEGVHPAFVFWNQLVYSLDGENPIGRNAHVPEQGAVQ